MPDRYTIIPVSRLSLELRLASAAKKVWLGANEPLAFGGDAWIHQGLFLHHTYQDIPDAFVAAEDNHYESEADSVQGLLLMYLRTGERGWFDLGEAWARYHMYLQAWRTDAWRWKDGGGQGGMAAKLISPPVKKWMDGQGIRFTTAAETVDTLTKGEGTWKVRAMGGTWQHVYIQNGADL